MRYLVPGPLPCPEVVAVFYIRPAEVPTLISVEGDAQVKHQNTVVGFLTTSNQFFDHWWPQPQHIYFLCRSLAAFASVTNPHSLANQHDCYAIT